MTDSALKRRFVACQQNIYSELDVTKDLIETLVQKKDKTISLLREEINKLHQMMVELQAENKILKQTIETKA